MPLGEHIVSIEASANVTNATATIAATFVAFRAFSSTSTSAIPSHHLPPLPAEDLSQCVPQLSGPDGVVSSRVKLHFDADCITAPTCNCIQPVEYEWYIYGSLYPDEVTNATHVSFALLFPGSYNASLRVRNPASHSAPSNTLVLDAFDPIGFAYLVVDLSYPPNATMAPYVVSDGTDPHVYEFHWGDGSPPTLSDSPFAEHVYVMDGSYEIRVNVSNPINSRVCRGTILVREDSPSPSSTPLTVIVLPSVVGSTVLIVVVVVVVQRIRRGRPSGSIQIEQAQADPLQAARMRFKSPASSPQSVPSRRISMASDAFSATTERTPLRIGSVQT